MVQRDGYGECLIFLGAYRSDQAAYLMRLIRIRYRGQWYSYITNVLDPFTLSGADVVRQRYRDGVLGGDTNGALADGRTADRGQGRA